MGSSSGLSWDTGNLGLGVVTKCVRGSFVGVWAAEFTLDSVGSYLSLLKDDLHGTIFIASADSTGVQDGYLFSSSGNSVSSITPCLTSGDYFVANAAAMIYSKYFQTFSKATDEAVLTDNIVLKTKVSSLTPGLLNVVSLSRGQINSKVDRMSDIIFAFATIVLCGQLWLSKMQNNRLESRVEHRVDQGGDKDEADGNNDDNEEEQRAETLDEVEVIYKEITDMIQPQVNALESNIRAAISKLNPTYSSTNVESAVTHKMRKLVVEFMGDSKCGRDATTHLKLLLMPYSAYHKVWAWTASGLDTIVFNTAAITGVILELALGSKDNDATTLYIVQGLILFALGFDVLINAKLEFTTAQPVEVGKRLKFHTETIVGVFVLPILWLLLCAAVLSSRAYDCNALPCAAKHYLWPLLFVFRNHRLYMSLFAFMRSMLSASTVLLLFLCFLLTTSAISTLMFRGVYTGSNYYENNQYFDFSTAFVTLFVFLKDGDNYVEAATIGFRDSLWYSLFLIFCTVMGLFFITSLLIEAFCGSYEEDQRAVWVLRKRNERRSNTVAMLCWSRHSYHSIGIFGPLRNITESNIAYQEYTDEGLTMGAFSDLVLADAVDSDAQWAVEATHLALEILTNLDKSGPVDTGSFRFQIATVLLDLLAEMSLEDMHAQLCAIMNIDTELLEDRRVALLMSLQAVSRAHMEFTFEESCWARGISPKDCQLEEALIMLPRLRGLVAAQSQEEEDLHTSVCLLLRNVYLRKWCTHRIFEYMDDSGDGRLQSNEFEQVCRLCAAMDELAGSKLLRLEGYRVSLQRQTETIQAMVEDVDVDSVESEHQCLHFAGLLGHDMLNERQLLESHVVFKRHAKKQGSHDTIDIDILEHALVDELFTWDLSSQKVKQSVTNVMAMSVAHNDKTIRFSKFFNLRELLMNSLFDEECQEHNEQETAVFRLLREHNRILEAIKLTRDSGVFGSAEVTFLFQLIAWGHCLLLSQYHSGEDLITVSALDQMHVVFALLPWLEVFIHLRAHGLRGYFLQIGGAAEAIYAWGTLMCLCVALPGVLVVETQSYHIISLGTARFLMAQTCLSIFTQNVRFSQMTQTLGTVSGASWPIVLSMSAVTCLYARAAHDIFSDKVIDDYGAEAYFGTYGRSLRTFFRFFVAQGWTAIMYSASNATTEAARLFFISYVLIVSLLLAQLVIKVIVNLFTAI